MIINPTNGFIGFEIDNPTNKIHINEAGANAVYTQWTNGTTGITGTDGLLVGISGAGAA